MEGRVLAGEAGNRRLIIKALRDELIGPAPAGKELDCTPPVFFAKAQEAYGPWTQKGTGEEILLRDVPTKRYGIGVLYPEETKTQESVDEAGEAGMGLLGGEENASGAAGDSPLTEQAAKSLETIEKNLNFQNDSAPGDFDL